jgi:hypothetical protein
MANKPVKSDKTKSAAQLFKELAFMGDAASVAHITANRETMQKAFTGPVQLSNHLEAVAKQVEGLKSPVKPVFKRVQKALKEGATVAGALDIALSYAKKPAVKKPAVERIKAAFDKLTPDERVEFLEILALATPATTPATTPAAPALV